MEYMRNTQTTRKDSQMDNPIGTYPIACVHCGTSHLITAPAAGFIAWEGGVLIQTALPELSADDRELLISHTCGKCWDKMFPE
jgi:hypothetical protein